MVKWSNYVSLLFNRVSLLSLSEAVSEPFSIVGPEPTEATDAYDIVQAMQEVQVQAHAAPSRLVDTSG